MTASTAELTPLDRAIPPAFGAELVVGIGNPLPALLDGVRVHITAVLDRTAVFERPGRDPALGREATRKELFLVDPTELVWAAPSRPLGKAHRCRKCRGTAAKVAFTSHESPLCQSCEATEAA